MAAQMRPWTVRAGEAEYPAALRKIYDPPPRLVVRGTLEAEDALAVAIVGSRLASPYALAVAEGLAADLAREGVTIVSGLALGVDGAAHRGAIRAGGRTIAVLGCGIDVLYPRRHAALSEEIARNGAVVTEFPDRTPPVAWNFPKRNRIIAGLALGVVVVEASEKSGSLVTAELAMAEGREVMAVPGEVGSARTRGVHRLLKDGAALVETATDVIEAAMPWMLATTPPAASRAPAQSAESARLLGAFDAPVCHVDRLARASGLSIDGALALLLELELSGLVRQHPGMTFSKTRPSPGR